MSLRVLSIVAAAGLLIAVTLWKLNQPERRPSRAAVTEAPQPAPLFEELDSRGRPVRLESLIGRHRILLIFFNSLEGAGKDPTLAAARARIEELERANVKVLAVSDAEPEENREMMAHLGRFGFPLLSDRNRDVLRDYGVFDPATRSARPAAFLIARDGTVAWRRGRPRSLDDPIQTITGLTANRTSDD